jgi:CDP-ribitol ribitolphosphotransferase
MTHDGSRDGNVGAMIEYLKEKSEGYTFESIKKSDRKMAGNIHRFKGKLSFFITKPYHLATSEFVLLDNVFLPMVYIHFPERVRVIQLWHGTGTIKKFGQDVNTGRLKRLEKRANDRVTHLVVNSDISKEEYAQAFGIPEEKIVICGLPRTDMFFVQPQTAERERKFFEQYPQLKGKKLILYAPTFRDKEKDNPQLILDIERLSREMPKDHVLMLRLHPYVMEIIKKNGDFSMELGENIISMSSYPDLNTLLLATDVLITDYSSIIFEYCLMEKPMLFFAYDLEEFSDRGRGFYLPYEEYVPGPVVRETQEVLDLLKKDQYNIEKIKEFKRKNYRYLDGKSAERIYLHIFKAES